MRILCLLFLFFSIYQDSSAQIRSYKGSFFSLSTSYLELKDDFNYGLVFRGPDIGIEFGHNNVNEKYYFEFSSRLEGGGKTTIGTWGFRWYISPINARYLWKVTESDGFNLYVGPSTRVNYNIQTYPDLHAGPIIWMSNYDLGVSVNSFFSLGNKLLEVRLNTNLFGWHSRPSEDRDPYFYESGFGDNFSQLHEKLNPGGLSEFRQTEFETRLYFKGKKRSQSISYLFAFTGYYNRVEFRELIHSLKFTWFIKSQDR